MTFPHYSEYKDSGVAWLGEVPGHWVITKTKYVTSFHTGWTPPTGKSESYSGENLWANISDLGEKWIFDTAKRISDEAVASARISPSPKGSLLFSFKLSIGQVSFAGQDMFTNEAIATFIPSEMVDVNYAYYAFPFFLVKNAAENIYGAKLLNQELIRAATLALPDIREQSTIAAFLDRETGKIDELIAEQQRLVELLAEKRQAVISHAVTKGMNPNARMKDSGIEWLGEVPEHWEVRAIKHIVSTPVTDGPHETPNFPDEGIPFVSAEAISSGKIDFGKIRGFISEADHLRYSEKYRPQRGDIYMVKSGATTGVTAIVETDIEFNIWSPLAVIRCGEKALPRFVLNFMRSKNFQEAVTLNWSFGTQQNIGMGVVENLSVPVPPIEEQQRIAALLDSESAKFDALAAEANRAIELLQERRSALISAAVTGKIDVRSLAASLHSDEAVVAEDS